MAQKNTKSWKIVGHGKNIHFFSTFCVLLGVLFQLCCMGNCGVFFSSLFLCCACVYGRAFFVYTGVARRHLDVCFISVQAIGACSLFLQVKMGCSWRKKRQPHACPRTLMSGPETSPACACRDWQELERAPAFACRLMPELETSPGSACRDRQELERALASACRVMPEPETSSPSACRDMP